MADGIHWLKALGHALNAAAILGYSESEDEQEEDQNKGRAPARKRVVASCCTAKRTVRRHVRTNGNDDR